MTDAIQVITTIPSKEQAESLARALVEERLAACVQVVGPIASTYRWEGRIESAQEWLCLIKTCQPFYLALEQAIRLLHPYEVPEILATPVVAGSAEYLTWLSGALGD